MTDKKTAQIDTDAGTRDRVYQHLMILESLYRVGGGGTIEIRHGDPHPEAAAVMRQLMTLVEPQTQECWALEHPKWPVWFARLEPLNGCFSALCTDRPEAVATFDSLEAVEAMQYRIEAEGGPTFGVIEWEG